MNKKALTLSLAILASTSLVSAQDDKLFTVGPKVGLAGTFWTGGDQPKDQNLKTGFIGGGFLTYSATRAFGLTLEVQYAQQGFRAKADDGGKVVLRTHYVQVPLLLRYFFVQEGAVRPNIFIGPSANFRVKSTETFSDQPATSGLKNGNVNTTSQSAPFELGVLAGLGINIRTLTDQWIDFNVRYNQGVTKLYKDDESKSYTNTYNGGVALSVGYGFGF